jgi:hypothetical protein
MEANAILEVLDTMLEREQKIVNDILATPEQPMKNEYSLLNMHAFLLKQLKHIKEE